MKLDIILKWTGTVILIAGTGINASALYPYPVGPFVLAVGGLIWTIVGLLWREWSLIILNGGLTILGFGGILANYLAS